jgi:type I restriction enzyme S subunit
MALNVSFLTRVLESEWALDQASACATGIAQKTVPLSGLRKMGIPLPPLAEQHRIVAKVDQLMAVCDRLEKQLTSTQTENRRLLEAVLDDALNGST